jgi:hypothetical protein
MLGHNMSQKLTYISYVLTTYTIRAITLIALAMGSVITSETSVNFCESTRRNVAEDGYIPTRHRENVKSSIINFDCFVVYYPV